MINSVWHVDVLIKSLIILISLHKIMKYKKRKDLKDFQKDYCWLLIVFVDSVTHGYFSKFLIVFHNSWNVKKYQHTYCTQHNVTCISFNFVLFISKNSAVRIMLGSDEILSSSRYHHYYHHNDTVHTWDLTQP